MFNDSLYTIYEKDQCLLGLLSCRVVIQLYNNYSLAFWRRVCWRLCNLNACSMSWSKGCPCVTIQHGGSLIYSKSSTNAREALEPAFEMEFAHSTRKVCNDRLSSDITKTKRISLRRWCGFYLWQPQWSSVQIYYCTNFRHESHMLSV